jgi:hypothetical protein
MRLIVMEFGRFTIDSAVEEGLRAPTFIMHQAPAVGSASGAR